VFLDTDDATPDDDEFVTDPVGEPETMPTVESSIWDLDD